MNSGRDLRRLVCVVDHEVGLKRKFCVIGTGGMHGPRDSIVDRLVY